VTGGGAENALHALKHRLHAPKAASREDCGLLAGLPGEWHVGGRRRNRSIRGGQSETSTEEQSGRNVAQSDLTGHQPSLPSWYARNAHGGVRYFPGFAASKRTSWMASGASSFFPAGNWFDLSTYARMSAFCERLNCPGLSAGIESCILSNSS